MKNQEHIIFVSIMQDKIAPYLFGQYITEIWLLG